MSPFNPLDYREFHDYCVAHNLNYVLRFAFGRVEIAVDTDRGTCDSGGNPDLRDFTRRLDQFIHSRRL